MALNGKKNSNNKRIGTKPAHTVWSLSIGIRRTAFVVRPFVLFSSQSVTAVTLYRLSKDDTCQRYFFRRLNHDDVLAPPKHALKIAESMDVCVCVVCALCVRWKKVGLNKLEREREREKKIDKNYHHNHYKLKYQWEKKGNVKFTSKHLSSFFNAYQLSLE